jgi:ethanolamine utilization protein EutN
VHLARVIGTVVATVKTERLGGQRLLVLRPIDASGEDLGGDPVVAVDLVSAAPGQRVFFVRAREAANAMADPFNPVDAAILGIVDRVRRAGIGDADEL